MIETEVIFFKSISRIEKGRITIGKEYFVEGDSIDWRENSETKFFTINWTFQQHKYYIKNIYFHSAAVAPSTEMTGNEAASVSLISGAGTTWTTAFGDTGSSSEISNK